MGRVTHFEIHTSDAPRSIAFYEAVLGWSFQQWNGPMPYWLITTGPADQPGIHGGLLQRQGEGPAGGEPVSSFVCTAQTDNLDETVARAIGAGATLAHPKRPVQGVGWLAYLKDLDGNLFGVMQTDPSAA